MALFSTALFVHLVSFAAYLGAGFAQQRFMKASTKPELAPAVRDEYERLAAAIVTKIELPAIIGSLVSGIVFVLRDPNFMRQGWLHGKLTVVLILLVLSHVEMFNARRIVRARAAGNADADISARKGRHATFGLIGTVLIVILMVLVTFVRMMRPA